MAKHNVDSIKLNDIEYVRKDKALEKPLPGKRHVLVLDRGWIVAGDITEETGRIKVSRALHVRSWSNIGFDGMIAAPKSKDVVIKPLLNGFDVPSDVELFRIPVSDDWGL